MKNKKVLLLAFFAGAILEGAGAQTPSSNTKTVTSGLIEDGIVDQFDTGVPEKDVLFFGGYGIDSGLIQSGFGKRFGDGLWFSLYDGYYMKADTKQKESAKSDSVSSDGVNTDYTDESFVASLSGSSRVKNNLAFSTYINDSFGGTFYWNIDYANLQGYSTTDPTGVLKDQSGTTNTKSSSQSGADDVTSLTEYDALENSSSVNTFGIDFNGAGTPYLFDDYKFYLKLNTLRFTMARRFIDIDYTTKTTLNGSTVDGQKQPSYSGTYDYNTYTPYVEAETGVTLKKMWDFITPKFTLIEGFKMSFKKNDNSYTYEENTANSTTVVTRKNTSCSMDSGDFTDWQNTITPRFDFDFDLGENITLKARAQVPVSFGNTITAADKYTTTVKSVTTDKTTGEVTSTRTVTTSGSATETDVFTTTVSPEFSVGFVYAVVPEKFNVNMGVSATSGTLTWKKTKTTNSHIPTVSTTTYTNPAGESVTTAHTYTAANGDGAESGDATAETEENTFNSQTPSATARLGFTWFFGEKAQVDTFLLYGSSSGTTEPVWALNFTLGLRI